MHPAPCVFYTRSESMCAQSQTTLPAERMIACSLHAQRTRGKRLSASRPDSHEDTMLDLSTTYLGLKLRTPLVSSASPLTQDIGSIRRLEDAGASAIVFHSLFEDAAQQSAPGRPALDHYLTLDRKSV